MNTGTGVLGVARQEKVMIAAVEQLVRKGFRNLKIFSPIPCEIPSEVLHAPKSPVRAYTLTGGLLGFATGLAWPIYTVIAWPLITGGKPMISLPPFLIIGFELTILFGGLFTLAGLAIHSRLKPEVSQRPVAGYDARFSVDRFGVFVACEGRQVEVVKELFLAAGVEETSVETA
jgi:hypothetical protein